MASPNTARSYVEALEKLMMVLTVSYLEPSGKVIHRKIGKFISQTRSSTERWLTTVGWRCLMML
ncbi:MAG: hypothetical protein QXV27_00240 [Candidatus Caldarchaeum sp.]